MGFISSWRIAELDWVNLSSNVAGGSSSIRVAYWSQTRRSQWMRQTRRAQHDALTMFDDIVAQLTVFIHDGFIRLKLMSFYVLVTDITHSWTDGR